MTFQAMLWFGLLPAMSLQLSVARAADGHCESGLLVEQAFASGATWSLCASLDEAHGLTISSASYRAPGSTLRSVLQQAHLGQLLLHYHDSTEPEVQIDPLLDRAFQGEMSNLLTMTSSTCQGELLDLPGRTGALCSRVLDNGILAKYAQRTAIQSQSLELASSFQRHTLTWTSSFTFTEDGQIRPGISLSGRASQTQTDARFAQVVTTESSPLTRATILATWRMVFDLDTPNTDRIEQFDFPLQGNTVNRRPMQVTVLDREQLLYVDRETFRGWRIVDSSGAGYYLDPANNGFSYRNTAMNWASADGAITVFEACEQHALHNIASKSLTSAVACGASLDDFIDNQPLQGIQPVLWYSQSRTLEPSVEDWPVLRDLIISFDLLPFDWTAASPFEADQ